MDAWQRWTLVASGPSIIDFLPASEYREHALGRKCACVPEKVLQYDGPHVVQARFLHHVLARRA